jgi:AraC-like DNA-binding protein
LLQRRYRELIRKHFSPVLDRLFAEFTGLHFHLAWTAATPKGMAAHALPSNCSVCCRLSGSPQLPECRTCGPHHLAATLKADGGHRFTCRMGIRNCWIPVRVRHETLGIAYLQALEHPRRRPTRHRSASTMPARSSRRDGVAVSRMRFARAARFLRHIVQHVQAASLSDLREIDLRAAGRAVVALEREQARLHETLGRYLPAAPHFARTSRLESHAEQVIHFLLERTELDYATPITLQRIARDLNMNAAYLSALFSRVVGVPFKTHLTGLRLQKARELLGDCARTVTDVAFAVGYSSEERFRCAFRKATGLCPKVWRETMQTTPSAGPA